MTTTYRLRVVGVPHRDFARGPLPLVVGQAVDLIRKHEGYTAIIRPIDSLSIIGVELSREGDEFDVRTTEESPNLVDAWVLSVPTLITRAGGSLRGDNHHDAGPARAGSGEHPQEHR